MKYRTERTRYWYMGGMLLLALVGLGLVGSSAAAKPSMDAPAGKAPDANDRPKAMPTCVPGWSVVDSPSPGTDSNWLRDVAVISADDVWAVGYHNDIESSAQTLIMHWNGREWSLSTDPIVGSGGVLWAVDGTSANDVWAGGYYLDGTIRSALLMHWDGSQWSTVSLPIPMGTVESRYRRIYDIEAISPNDAWAVIYSNVGTVTLHWDGMSWSEIPLSSSNTYFDLRAISAVSSGDVWAVGWQGNEDGNSPAVQHWNGTNWSNVPIPSSSVRREWIELEAVAALSTDNVWVVGYYRAGNSASYDIPLVLHWDGAGWREVPDPVPPRAYGILTAVTAGSPNDVWIGGSTGPDDWSETMFRHWDGQMLNNVQSINPGFSSSFEGMDATAGEVWAVGHYSVMQGGEDVDLTLVARYTQSCAGSP